MATVAVTFDGTRVSNAATATDGGTWDKWNATQAPAVEPDFYYEGSGSLSNKVGTVAGGVEMDQSTGTHDFSTTAQVWLAKVIATNYAALNVKGSTGMILYIGDSNSNYNHYYVHGSDTYPKAGGWVFIAIDPNVSGYRDVDNTITLTAIDYWGVSCDFTATSKSENVAMDALDYFPLGGGYTLVGGDGVSTDGVFDDFVSADEGGTATVSEVGVVRTVEGVLYVLGTMTIGSATATVFNDTGTTIVFPDTLTAAGFAGIAVGMSNASNDINFTANTWISRGNTTTTDTRACFVVTGTTGVGCTLNTCRLVDFHEVTLTSKVTVQSGCDIEAQDLTQGTAEIKDSTIRTTSLTSIATLQDPTFGTTSGLHDCEFIQAGAGHAIEIDTAGDYTLTNLTWTGYGADASDSAAVDVTETTGTVNLNWSGGSAPTYKTAGATVNVNNTKTVKVTVKRADTFAVIESARAYVEAASGGDLPSEESVTITRVTTTATVAHTAHGLPTGTSEVAIRGANQGEYNGPKTVTYVDANSYTYTVSGTPDTPATGTITATAVLLNDTTNASGIAQNTAFKYTSAQPVQGYVRKMTSTPLYKETPLTGSVTTSGYDVTALMVDDE